VLFLKEIKNNDLTIDNYLTLEKGKVSISDIFVPNLKNYAIVGVLGSNSNTNQNTILKRLNLLEKKVFGK
jgi:hypothetical protein